MELVTTIVRRNGRTQKVCRCKRLAFPHRLQSLCSDYLPQESYEYDDGPGKQFWADYADRVRDLRREL